MLNPFSKKGRTPKWEPLSYKLWPRWILRASPNDTLRATWEGKYRLIFHGKTFEYRVTPALVDQGHWEVGQIERRPRWRRK